MKTSFYKFQSTMKKTLNPRFLTLLCFILAIALLRIANSAQLTPFAQYTPIGAMCLFGGAYFPNRWKAFAFPILTLLVSDLVINKVIFRENTELCMKVGT